jgi:hypothetical protein
VAEYWMKTTLKPPVGFFRREGFDEDCILIPLSPQELSLISLQGFKKDCGFLYSLIKVFKEKEMNKLLYLGVTEIDLILRKEITLGQARKEIIFPGKIKYPEEEWLRRIELNLGKDWDDSGFL